MDGWTLRLTAAALLTLCGAAGGRSLACARRLRVQQLEHMVSAIGRLRVQMLERRLALGEALIESGHPALARVADGLEGAHSVLGAYMGARSALRARGGALSALTDEDAAVLERLFEGLGATGASEQRLLLDGASEELKRLAALARKLSDEQARLYTSLGLIAGLSLSICLL